MTLKPRNHFSYDTTQKVRFFCEIEKFCFASRDSTEAKNGAINTPPVIEQKQIFLIVNAIVSQFSILNIIKPKPSILKRR